MNPERNKKKLLIIKATATGLTGVETFLKNREWELKSTNNLKEALIFLVQQQPEFVMICVDHHNKKVRNLPRVLAQAFPICVIVYSEDNSAAAHQLLAKCSTKYMLYPPVTGPAVERTVNRYYKDLQNDGFSSTKQAFDYQKNNPDSVIAIRGDSASSEMSTENLLASLMAEDDSSIVQTGVKANAMSSQDGHGAGRANSAHQEGDEVHTMLSDQDPRNSPGKQGPLWGAIEQHAHKLRTSKTAADIHNDPRSNKSNSLIFKGTNDAIEKSRIHHDVTSSAEIPQTSMNSACITVESNRFAGYLLAVAANDIALDEAFIAQIRTRLFSFLRANGETVEDRELMNLKLKPVPFEDWALRQAEFLRKSTHKGQDIAMAFFPRPEMQTGFLESTDQHMFLVAVNELQADVIVEFNLYMYLPKNNKYVLYTPKGGVFYGKQKDRLTAQGISQMHILRSDAPHFEKYRTQNYLNSKISEYEEGYKTEPA